jgi:small conductance mechanosensitive channel
MGVQSLDVDHFQLRVVARTLPGEQFRVGRMLRVRIAAGLRREGIYLPPSLETAEPDGVSNPSNASGASGPPDPFSPAGPAGSD